MRADITTELKYDFLVFRICTYKTVSLIPFIWYTIYCDSICGFRIIRCRQGQRKL